MRARKIIKKSINNLVYLINEKDGINEEDGINENKISEDHLLLALTLYKLINKDMVQNVQKTISEDLR